MSTKRLDVLLVEKGLVPSRKRAQARILAGDVLVNGRPISKSGTQVRHDVEIVLRGKNIPYVSRGGLKLEKAIHSFGLDFHDKVVLDVGSSTGGFTDCALQHGASKVYAIDVGYGQLAWSLRQNPKVEVLERTNVRYLDKTKLAPLPEIACIDVSFISLEKVIPPVVNVLMAKKELVALIKPQFEVGRGRVGKGGIVRNSSLHQAVLSRIVDLVNKHLNCVGLDYSPITGTKGNIEYLVYARQTPLKWTPDIDAVVATAHGELGI